MTEIDVASQRVIEATIADSYPSHGFLGEESVDAGHCASIGRGKFSHGIVFVWSAVDYASLGDIATKRRIS